MGKIINSYIVPHPPVLIPEIGNGKESKASNTLNSLIQASKEIGEKLPSTIIITTPHAPIFSDYIYISTDDLLNGNFGDFRRKDLSFTFKNNLPLVEKIIEYSKEVGIECGGINNKIAKKYKISKQIDHGALVPLYFIRQYLSNFKLVHLAVAGLPMTTLYQFGKCIAKAIAKSQDNVVFIASGDLSHRLSPDGPYGYSHYGKEFDEIFINNISNMQVENLLSIDEDLCENAGECGLRAFAIMLGALDNVDVTSKVYSYEGPFGVGYSVIRFDMGNENTNKNILDNLNKKNREKIDLIRQNEDPYVKLARTSLEYYIKEHKILKNYDSLLNEMLENQAGVFVSIKKHGQLRGCIGTISATRSNIANEITYNAISAGTKDPRFQQVTQDDLRDLVYSVDILSTPEPIESMQQLDVIKYGIIVRHGMRSGLLLPNLEGVNSVKEQVSIALRKARIDPGEKYSMERFEVVRHK